MVGGTLVAAAVLLPLALALALAVPVVRRCRWLPAVAACSSIPLLLLPFAPGQIDVDWIVLGISLATDTMAMPLLLAAGLLWTAAGWHAVGQFAGDAYGWRYWLFHLLTLGGNAGVLLAQDLVSLYVAYALMTFSAYGLIVHDREPQSMRAGRIYIVLAMAAEALLIASLLMMGAQLGNAPLATLPALLAEHPDGRLLVALLFIGFAVKMGTMPLHVWLPLAHPRAPVPASAVLSGVIVKAGLVGWLRLLPLDADGFADYGALIVVVGLGSAFAAALIGLTQHNAKVVLAYSTVSQMGLITALLGTVFLEPATATVVVPVILLFALHHALAKGALFLGMGVHTAWRQWLMLLPAAGLAGLPFTSGALAKSAAKGIPENLPGGWSAVLEAGFALSSVVTTLLMIHLLALVWTRDPARDRTTVIALLPCGLIVLAGPTVAWLHAATGPALQVDVLTISGVWAAVWPAALATMIAWTARLAGLSATAMPVPEGDLVTIGERVGRRIGRLTPAVRVPRPALRVTLARLPVRTAFAFDRRRLRLAAAGGILLIAALLLTRAALGQ